MNTLLAPTRYHGRFVGWRGDDPRTGIFMLDLGDEVVAVEHHPNRTEPRYNFTPGDLVTVWNDGHGLVLKHDIYRLRFATSASFRPAIWRLP